MCSVELWVGGLLGREILPWWPLHHLAKNPHPRMTHDMRLGIRVTAQDLPADVAKCWFEPVVTSTMWFNGEHLPQVVGAHQTRTWWQGLLDVRERYSGEPEISGVIQLTSGQVIHSDPIYWAPITSRTP